MRLTPLNDLFKFFLLAYSVFMSNVVFASITEGSAPSPISRLVTKIYSSEVSSEKTVKVALFIDQSVLTRYSLGWNTRSDGTPIENGEPFVRLRIASMLSALNSQVKQQGLPVHFEIAHTQIIDTETMVKRDKSHAHNVFGRLAMCFWASADQHTVCQSTREILGDQQYTRYQEAMAEADVFLYWREKRHSEAFSGLAYQGVGLAILDTYHQHCLGKPIDEGMCSADEPTFFSLLHEAGHLLGVVGHDSEECKSSPSIMRSKMLFPATTFYFPKSDDLQCQEAREARQAIMTNFSMKLPNSKIIRRKQDH